MKITIDGPAGSGKSTAARKLAARLEIAYLDTGAMYRAAALKCLRDETELDDPAAIIQIVTDVDIQVDCGPTHTRVLLDGHDVSEAIRTMEVNQATSAVSRIPEVRRLLVEQQQIIGETLGSLVTEGRDQGSVVFPEADARFFLDASLEKRAERRFHEMRADGIEVTYKEVLENLSRRDNNDQCQWAPLLEHPSTIKIDTTHMTIAEVVDQLAACIAELQTNGQPS